MSLRRGGRIAGPLAAAPLYAWIPDTRPDTAGGELILGTAGRIAVVAWMAIWWMTESVSILVTALVPALVFPLIGVQDFLEITAVYAQPLFFLAMGGFVLALALARWELHHRTRSSSARECYESPTWFGPTSGSIRSQSY